MQQIMVLILVPIMVMGLLCLGTGLRLLNRRPLVLTARHMGVFVLLGFLPMPILVASGLLGGKHSQIDLFMLVMSFFLLLLLGMVLGLLRRTLFVFNVTEDDLFEATRQVYERQGVACQEKRSRLIVPSLEGELAVQVRFESGSIRASRPELLKGFAPQLRQALKDCQLREVSMVAYLLLVVGSMILVQNGFIWSLAGWV